MTKEKFNWKSLFINEEGTDEEAPSVPTASKPDTTSSAPKSESSKTKFPEKQPKAMVLSDSILSSIIEMYESGFESLNQPGYDFYEFFKAVKAVGSNDPQVYKMALTMAQGVDRNVTKDSLLTQAEFYVEEIKKVHKLYETQGNGKRESIQNNQKVKKTSLTSEISSLEKKLMEIQNKISTKRNELESLDLNMKSEIDEIDQKIIANDTAKTKILDAIVTVIEGIKKNT